MLEIQHRGGIADAEMARVFNLGLGMVAVVPGRRAARALGLLREAGHAAVEVGRLTAATGAGREVHLA